MVMVLPFLLGLIAAFLAVGGRRNTALGLGLVTVLVQVWWLIYHATDKLAVSL
jgi:Na+-transporting NADH:ubiquinone oxidoreductase subunit NqrE